MSTEVIAVVVLAVMALMLMRCQYSRDAFLPSQSWEDWDNYDKDYGQTRAYWGAMDAEGGWTGNLHAPDQDPSGLGFGAASPNYGRQYGRGAFRPPKKEIDLAHASEDELASEYRMGIMANR